MCVNVYCASQQRQPQYTTHTKKRCITQELLERNLPVFVGSRWKNKSTVTIGMLCLFIVLSNLVKFLNPTDFSYEKLYNFMIEVCARCDSKIWPIQIVGDSNCGKNWKKCRTSTKQTCLEA